MVNAMKVRAYHLESPKGNIVLPCPDCGGDAKVDGMVTCLDKSCGYKKIGMKAAKDFQVSSFGTFAKDNPATWGQNLYYCPDCEQLALVDNLSGSVDTDPARFICFFCGMRSADERLVFCCRCAQPFEPNGALHCGDCIDEVQDV